MEPDFQIYQGPIGETITREGAERIAGTIRKYWYDRGFNGAVVKVLPRHSNDGRRNVMGWDVRSNLVNGVPPRAWRFAA